MGGIHCARQSRSRSAPDRLKRAQESDETRLGIRSCAPSRDDRDGLSPELCRVIWKRRLTRGGGDPRDLRLKDGGKQVFLVEKIIEERTLPDSRCREDRVERCACVAVSREGVGRDAEKPVANGGIEAMRAFQRIDLMYHQYTVYRRYRSQLLGLEKTDAFGRRAHGRQPRWKTANVCPRSSERALLGAKPNFNLRHVAVGGRPHAERQALSIGAAPAPGTSPFCKSSLAKGNAAAPAIWTRAPLRAAKSGNSGSTIFAAASARSETGGAASQDLTSNRSVAPQVPASQAASVSEVASHGGREFRGAASAIADGSQTGMRRAAERGRDFSARGRRGRSDPENSRREARRSAPSQRARGDAPRHRQTWF